MNDSGHENGWWLVLVPALVLFVQHVLRGRERLAKIRRDIAAEKKRLEKLAKDQGIDDLKPYRRVVDELLADGTRAFHLKSGLAQAYADDPDFLALVIATDPVARTIADSGVRNENDVSTLFDTDAFKEAEQLHKEFFASGEKGFYNYLHHANPGDAERAAAAAAEAADDTKTPKQRARAKRFLGKPGASSYTGLTTNPKQREEQHASGDGGAPLCGMLMRRFAVRSFLTESGSEVVMNAKESLFAAVRARRAAPLLSRDSRL